MELQINKDTELEKDKYIFLQFFFHSFNIFYMGEEDSRPLLKSALYCCKTKKNFIIMYSSLFYIFFYNFETLSNIIQIHILITFVGQKMLC